MEAFVTANELAASLGATSRESRMRLSFFGSFALFFELLLFLGNLFFRISRGFLEGGDSFPHRFPDFRYTFRAKQENHQNQKSQDFRRSKTES